MDSLEEIYKLEYPVFYQALCHHKTHQNKSIRFENHKYLSAIYKDKSHHIVSEKGTQSGISEYLINYAIQKSISGLNVLYTLPTELIKARFVQSRFNTSLQYTKYYQEQLKDMDSASMKALGKGVINFVGSNSEANFAQSLI